MLLTSNNKLYKFITVKRLFVVKRSITQHIKVGIS